MDEPLPPITPVETAAPVYKDRSTGLVIFGILTLLLGCLAGLFVPLMLFSQAAAARATQSPSNVAAMLPVACIYGVLAVALFWLGIGSIQARRWARAILLIFSWSWLAMGIMVMIAMAVILPKSLGNLQANDPAGHPATPPGAMAVVMVIMFLVFSVIFVLIPAVWVFFYGSRHVKATCETRDPVPGWTDACPLPVLGLSLWLALSLPAMLLTPLTGHAVMPFFGFFMTGITASLIILIMAAIWAYAAWSVYHLKLQGWWLLLIALGILMVSSWVTFTQHDPMDMYHAMGYPQAQIDQIQKVGLMAGNNLRIFMCFSMLPFMAYLLFIKKYFPKKVTA